MNSKMNFTKIALSTLIITTIAIVGITSVPNTTHAIRIGDILDPFHIFHDNDNNKSKPKAAPAPKLEANCSPDVRTIDEGDYVTWTVNPTGGTNVYTYRWSGTESLTGDTRDVQKTYTSPGYKYASVHVWSGGQNKEFQCTGSVLVRAYREGSNSSSFRATCSADDDEVEVDDRVEWSVRVSGGRSPYTYDWSGTNGLSGFDRTVTKRYKSEGTKSAEVIVTDDRGDEVIADCDEVEVFEDLRDRNRSTRYYDDNNYNDENLSLFCSPNTYSAPQGSTVTWTAVPTGGSGYTYNWSGTDSVSGNSRSINARYTTPGSKNAVVTVRSSNGRTASASCGNVTIVGNVSYESPAPVYRAPVASAPAAPIADLSVKCSANQSSVKTDESVAWTAEVSGGTGTYSYKWMGTDELAGNQAVVVKSYKTEGDKFAVVTVNSGSKSANMACSPVVKVGAVSSALGAAAFLGAGLSWAAVGVIVLVLLFLVIAYVLYNKEKIK